MRVEQKSHDPLAVGDLIEVGGREGRTWLGRVTEADEKTAMVWLIRRVG